MILALSVSSTALLHHGLSGDVFWQWAAGRHMLQTGSVIRFDPFSFTRPGKAWIDGEWGFQLLLAAGVAWTGAIAFWWVPLGWVLVTLWVLARQLHRLGAGSAKIGLVLILTGLALSPVVKDRPQVASYVMFLLMIEGIEASRRRRDWGWRLAPLLVLWANLHGSFILGWLQLLWEGLWRWNHSPKSRGFLGMALAAGGLTVINPYGIGLWRHTLTVLRSPIVTQQIAEWQSPNFHSLGLLFVIVGPMLLMGSALYTSKTRVPWQEWVMVSALWVATLHSVRFLPYFALSWPRLLVRLTPNWEFRSVKPAWITGVALLATLGTVGSAPLIPPGQAAGSVPVSAVAYLSGKRGRIFNAYRWGGYLIAHHLPVFVDGRTDFYLSSPVLDQYLAIKGLSINPDALFQRYRIRWVLWPPRTPLATFLLQDPHWRRVYRSGPAWVFERT